MSEPKASVSERLRLVKSRLSYMTPNYDKHAAELEALATEIEALAAMLRNAPEDGTDHACCNASDFVADALAPRKEGM